MKRPQLKPQLITYLIIFGLTSISAQSENPSTKLNLIEETRKVIDAHLDLNSKQEESTTCPSTDGKKCCTTRSSVSFQSIQPTAEDFIYTEKHHLLYEDYLKLDTPSLADDGKKQLAQDLFVEGVMRHHSYESLQSLAFFNELTELEPESPFGHWGVFWTTRNSSSEKERSMEAYQQFVEKTLAQKKRKAQTMPTRAEHWLTWSTLWQYMVALNNIDSRSFPYDRRSPLYPLVLKQFEKLQKDYPSDLDGELFAATFIKFRDYNYPTPSKGSHQEALLDALEKRPNHPGILHYLIHAYEVREWLHPFLKDVATNITKFGNESAHFLHMAGHIHYDFGQYEKARESFLNSYRTDSAYSNRHNIPRKELWNWVHNLDFLAVNNSETGRHKESLRYLDELDHALGAFDKSQGDEQLTLQLFHRMSRMRYNLRTQNWVDAINAIDKILEDWRGIRPYSDYDHLESEYKLLIYRAYAELMIGWGERNLAKVSAAREKIERNFKQYLIVNIESQFSNTVENKEHSHREAEAYEEYLLSLDDDYIKHAVKNMKSIRINSPRPFLKLRPNYDIERSFQANLDTADYPQIAYHMAIGLELTLNKGSREAYKSLEKALEMEHSRPIEITRQYLGPVEEQLAEAAIYTNYAPQALSMFSYQEEFWPNTARANLGRARVHVAAKNSAKAKSEYWRFLKKWKNADRDHPWVVEAQSYLNSNRIQSSPPK